MGVEALTDSAREGPKRCTLLPRGALLLLDRGVGGGRFSPTGLVARAPDGRHGGMWDEEAVLAEANVVEREGESGGSTCAPAPTPPRVSFLEDLLWLVEEEVEVSAGAGAPVVSAAAAAAATATCRAANPQMESSLRFKRRACITFAGLCLCCCCW